MEKIGLVIALRRTIMKGVSFAKFREEMSKLSIKEKNELVAEFNKAKACGEDVEVVESTIE